MFARYTGRFANLKKEGYKHFKHKRIVYRKSPHEDCMDCDVAIWKMRRAIKIDCLDSVASAALFKSVAAGEDKAWPMTAPEPNFLYPEGDETRHLVWNTVEKKWHPWTLEWANIGWSLCEEVRQGTKTKEDVQAWYKAWREYYLRPFLLTEIKRLLDAGDVEIVE